MRTATQFYYAAIEALRAGRLRVTSQRKAVLKILSSADQPLSVEEIHEEVGTKTCDRVTIYRNLESFEQAGILQRCVLEDGKALFELIARDQGHHHHIICRECHRVEKIDQCFAKSLVSKAAALGYSQINHVVEIYGICRECGAVGD